MKFIDIRDEMIFFISLLVLFGFQKYIGKYTIILFAVLTIWYIYQDWVRASENIWRISIRYVSLPFIVWFILDLAAMEFCPFIVNFQLPIAFISIVLVSVFMTFVLRHKPLFLERMKVSLRINSTLYFIIVTGFLIWAYSAQNISAFFDQESIILFQSHGLGISQAITLGAQLLLFPFMLSNFVVGAIVEYLLFRRNYGRQYL